MTLGDPIQPVRLWPTPDEEEEAVEVAVKWRLVDEIDWLAWALMEFGRPEATFTQ